MRRLTLGIGFLAWQALTLPPREVFENLTDWWQILKGLFP